MSTEIEMNIIICDIRDTIGAELAGKGYMMRGEMIDLFDRHRRHWKELAGDTEQEFTIRGCKLSSLPRPHITMDYTNQTMITVSFPSGDITQTTKVRGFA